jgi:hypothetical protein
MRRERWRVVERLLDQVEGTTGRLVMAVAPEPLDVVLYETPVLVGSQPPHNPLRGFIQEGISLLEQPTSAEIADLLHLPNGVVELVLGNLRQIGGAVCDVAGRWGIPEGAPIFRAGGGDPAIWRRARRLLCYWPQRQVLLPVLPRLRLRDLVELGVHNLQGDVAEWYAQFQSWPIREGLRRGLPDSIRILPLVSSSAAGDGTNPAPAPDAPVSREEILVSKCQLDVIALTWCSRRSGVWELVSRMWSRPTTAQESEGEPFSPGECLVGLTLPENLLGEGASLDALGQLFDSRPELWRNLLEEQEGLPSIRRDLENDGHALLLSTQQLPDERRRWRGLYTSLAREARLLCCTSANGTAVTTTE